MQLPHGYISNGQCDRYNKLMLIWVFHLPHYPLQTRWQKLPFLRSLLKLPHLEQFRHPYRLTKLPPRGRGDFDGGLAWEGSKGKVAPPLPFEKLNTDAHHPKDIFG